MGRNQRSILIIVGAVIFAVAAFVIFKPDDDEPASPQAGQTPTSAPAADEPRVQAKAPPKPKVTTIEVRSEKPVGGVKKIGVRNGEIVQFVAKSDVQDEVHVHGFDISKGVGPGQPARFRFKADIEGVFEVELEERAIPIAEVEVRP